MGLQHQVCGAHVVLAAVFKELDLQGSACEDRTDGDRQEEKITRRSQMKDGAQLTDFLTVVGQPWSSTGPLSVSLILKRREKLMGRM